MSNTGDSRGGRVWARNVAYTIRKDPMCKLAYPGICTGKSETADHKTPVSEGGRDTPDNLQGACKACNWHRGNRALPGQDVPQEPRGPQPTQGPTIVFDGAEKPSHRVLLAGLGVTNFGFSFWRARRRGFPKTKPYMLSDYFPQDAEIFVDSGWMQAQEGLEAHELEAYAEEYRAFLERNQEWVSGATHMHLTSLGQEWLQAERLRAPLEQERMWAVWTPAEGQAALHALASQHPNVALTQAALEDPVIPPRLRALQGQFGTAFHAQGLANPDLLRGLPLETASTISWASPQMRGETIVWDGTRLARYQANRKAQARPRYKAVVEKAGLDYEKFLADDPNESTRVAVWSYLQLEKSLNNGKPPLFVVGEGPSGDINVTESAKQELALIEENEGGDVAQRPSGWRNPMLPTVRPREASEMREIPGFGIERRESHEMSPDGQLVISEKRFLSSNSVPVRQCNTCVISSSCPAFKADSACAFELPVEVKTKEQRKAVMDAILEIQTQRVAFASFAEGVNGGYPDPNLSQEIDRLAKLFKTVRDLESSSETVRVTMERTGTSGGVLSQLFGEHRTQPIRDLDQPTTSDAIIGQVLGPQ